MDEKCLIKTNLIRAEQNSKPADTISAFLLKLADQTVPINTLRNENGTPVLNIAIEAVMCDNWDGNINHISVIRRLLRDGADPLLTDRDGQTALHAAACVDHVVSLCSMMMGRNIETLLKLENNDGDTLLHLAARSLCAETAECLMFAGADPTALNKKKETCSQVVPQKSNTMKNILRRTRVKDRLLPVFIISEQTTPFRSQTGHFSIALGCEVKEAARPGKPTTVMIRTKAPRDLDPAVSCRDGEIFWGHGMEYWSSSQTEAKITFFLHDRVDTFHRLVIRLKAEEKEEKEYNASVKDYLPQEEEEEELETSGEVAGHDTPYVSIAWAHVQLGKSGSVSLVYGPASDTIELGPQGGDFEFSKDPAVKLKASCTDGRTIPEGTKLNLQVEKAPALDILKPLEPASEEAAEENPTPQPVLLAMTDFLSVRGPQSLVDNCPLALHATLPLCKQFRREHLQAFIFVRSDGQSSQDGENVNEEMKMWTQNPEGLTLRTDASCVSLQTPINKITTVVQSSEGADPQEVKRAIAEQHIKSRQVPVRFHVFERPCQPTGNGDACSPGECSLIIAVKARQEDSSSADAHDQPEGCGMIKVSDVLYVPHNLQIRISIDQTCRVIIFQHGVHANNVGNSCGFNVNRHERTYRKVILKIEKSKMLTQREENFNWKPMTDLDISLPPIIAPPGPPAPPDPPTYTFADVDGETDEDPVNDQLLADLARQIPPLSVYLLGIGLGLDSPRVDNIQQSNNDDAFTKCFRILRHAKSSCQSSRDFVQCLYKALGEHDLNEQRKWLMEKLKYCPRYKPQWAHFSALPHINNSPNVDQ